MICALCANSVIKAVFDAQENERDESYDRYDKYQNSYNSNVIKHLVLAVSYVHSSSYRLTSSSAHINLPNCRSLHTFDYRNFLTVFCSLGSSLTCFQLVLSFVDGSVFARDFLSVGDRRRLLSFVRPVGAVLMTAGPDEVRVPGSRSYLCVHETGSRPLCDSCTKWVTARGGLFLRLPATR